MADRFFELFFEIISYLFVGREMECSIAFIAFDVYLLIFVTLQLLSLKRIDRKRTSAVMLLMTYDIFAFIIAAVFRWWFAIIVIILCYLYLRSVEKEIWEYEIEKKRVEGEIKDLLLSPKGIWINIALTYLSAYLILYIASFL